MKKLGRYCKAYPIEKLRKFDGWVVKTDESKKNEENSSNSPALSSEYLFLQEDFTVTRGVFLDEQIVFDAVTEEWKGFCRNTLDFAVPSDDHDKAGAVAERKRQPEEESAV